MKDRVQRGRKLKKKQVRERREFIKREIGERERETGKVQRETETF